MYGLRTMTTTESLANENVSLLRDGMALLAKLDDLEYSTGPAHISPHRAGGHLRHCIEFYECLLEGMGSNVVDYDGRRRDAALETSRSRAIERLEDIVTRLENCAACPAERSLRVYLDGAESISTISRELQFLRSHTVHHYALIAITLRLQGIDVPTHFGVAPATLRHMETAACAR
jgi:exonuclease VII small subunit